MSRGPSWVNSWLIICFLSTVLLRLPFSFSVLPRCRVSAPSIPHPDTGCPPGQPPLTGHRDAVPLSLANTAVRGRVSLCSKELPSGCAGTPSHDRRQCQTASHQTPVRHSTLRAELGRRQSTNVVLERRTRGCCRQAVRTSLSSVPSRPRLADLHAAASG